MTHRVLKFYKSKMGIICKESTLFSLYIYVFVDTYYLNLKQQNCEICIISGEQKWQQLTLSHCIFFSNWLSAVFYINKWRNFAVKHVKIMRTKHDTIFMRKTAVLALVLVERSVALLLLRVELTKTRIFRL